MPATSVACGTAGGGGTYCECFTCLPVVPNPILPNSIILVSRGVLDAAELTDGGIEPDKSLDDTRNEAKFSSISDDTLSATLKAGLDARILTAGVSRGVDAMVLNILFAGDDDDEVAVVGDEGRVSSSLC